MAHETLHSATTLIATVRAIVKAAGSSDYEAELVATNLVEANLRGHDSHGIGMIPRYIDAITEKGLTVNAHPSIVLDSGALLTVNGNAGYGQVIGFEAMQWAITRAQAHGVCVMGLTNSHHIGRIGHWAEQAAAAGLVSVHFVNVISRPVVAPWGGRDARHGTNPFCVGIPRPGAEGPIILDFATSRIAQGKTRVAYNKGEPVAPGILIDDAGNPSTDPRWSVIEPLGAILPFGEHKGSGLALVCELLGGALAGGLTAHEASEGKRRVLNGMLSIVIDPARMGTASNLFSELEAFVQWHTASPAASGADQVLIAGDPERNIRKKRIAGGIPVDATTWEELLAAGERAGITRAALASIAS
jgi:hydroxycarboxylate dehydrogenase B